MASIFEAHFAHPLFRHAEHLVKLSREVLSIRRTDFFLFPAISSQIVAPNSGTGITSPELLALLPDSVSLEMTRGYWRLEGACMMDRKTSSLMAIAQMDWKNNGRMAALAEVTMEDG